MRLEDVSLRAGFLTQASVRPSAPALVLKDRVWTYGELDEIARRWAGAILSRLGRPAERIGVFGSRSEVSYIASLAALYSGAAFVPLNPRFPADRTRAMIRRAELDAIFVDKLASSLLTAVLNGLEKVPPIWLPDTLSRAELISSRPLGSELPGVTQSDLAYLLFTSGTMGTPKGVPILHSNVRSFLNWARKRYETGPEDRFSQTFDQTFDPSIFDLFVAWESGACVYAMSPVDLLAPSKFINKNCLTVWSSVPSIPAQLRKRSLLGQNTLPTLRWSLFCGEPLPKTSAEEWQAAAPNSIVENLYGPTELTITCTVHRWDPRISPGSCVNGTVAIGRPYPGLTAVLVDDRLRPVPYGEAGELCISGPQTSPGYWKDPARTAERFVKLPTAEFPNEIFYRTGDQARQLPNGEYVYLGRSDHQIKVLGFRVELGEVEEALHRGAGVVQGVAMGWPVSEGTAQGIVAFVTGDAVDVVQLKNICKMSLADYMVPSRIIFIDEMPQNTNGKIDRAELRARLESGKFDLAESRHA